MVDGGWWMVVGGGWWVVGNGWWIVDGGWWMVDGGIQEEMKDLAAVKASEAKMIKVHVFFPNLPTFS